jgi:hypothetical protein
MVLLSSRICADFCLDILSIEENWVLRSPTIMLSGPICFYKLKRVCFMNVETLMFHAYICRIAISSY